MARRQELAINNFADDDEAVCDYRRHDKVLGRHRRGGYTPSG
jgi:hypothetical protein